MVMKNIWIYDDEMYERYSTLNVNLLTFNPLLYSNKLVWSIVPKKNEKEFYGTLIYPDGMTIPQVESFIDIKVREVYELNKAGLKNAANYMFLINFRINQFRCVN